MFENDGIVDEQSFIYLVVKEDNEGDIYEFCLPISRMDENGIFKVTTLQEVKTEMLFSSRESTCSFMYIPKKVLWANTSGC